MTHDPLDIPPFLRRRKGQRSSLPSVETPDDTPQISRSARKVALTAALKDRIAREIIAAVLQGHNTFGKLRKVLGHEEVEIYR